MGHIESERCLFLKALGLKTLNKKGDGKFVVEKPPSRPLPHTCGVPLLTRESWRDERLREGHARGHTHTHTQREREFLKRESERETVCYRAFCESYKRERD